jgi:hypothetical protein
MNWFVKWRIAFLKKKCAWLKEDIQRLEDDYVSKVVELRSDIMRAEARLYRLDETAPVPRNFTAHSGSLRIKLTQSGR